MTNHRSHLVGAALISTLCSTHAFVVRDAPMTKSAPSPGPALLNKIKDTTKIGDLVVPNVGIGTIAWSPKESTLDDLELQNLVSEACQSNAAFFDTGERYEGDWEHGRPLDSKMKMPSDAKMPSWKSMA